VKIRVLAIAMCLVLAGSACGTRASKSDVEAANEGGSAAQTSSGPSDQPTGPTDGVMFGTLASPCGPGDATGATDVGVSDGEIAITTIADPGTAAAPGLNQGVFDSMKAFEKWCNGQGGINGRAVKVNLRDAKLTEYQAQVKAACQSDLALVGGIGVLDEQGAQDQVDCGLPNVPAAAVSPQQTGADLTYQPLPNPVDRYLVGPARWVAENFPDAITNAAALRTKISVTEVQSNRLIQAYEQVGFDFTYVDSANVGELNWAPLVVAMKNQGITYLTLTSSFEEIIPLQKEMALQGFEPTVIEQESNFYNQKYPDQAGEVSNGTFIRLTVWPFEEADLNPAMADYLSALEDAVPGAVPELLGVQAFSAALLWATAIDQLGSNVTRQGLAEVLSNTHAWDGGGMHGTGDPGAQVPAGCFLMLRVDNGRFVRQYPLEDEDEEVYQAGRGFDCSPENTAELTGDFAAGAEARG
jgi:ABC-type branched-subunit amino acid transport system substrate-binding protein